MAQAEAIVQKWVRAQLEGKYGKSLYIFKVPQGQYTSRRGIPDLVMSVNGLFVAIEVKTKSGSLTKLQSHELAKIHESGALSFVIYDKDSEMMEVIFQQIDNRLL